ncbi:uncharacterized protein F54H12.2-like [Harpegnathos saltator]|uniref:uncharacterized protein F54H12.2-like n=1 Tax=Harpegnathos saltator TaxID=610380 RepID=UPI000DBEE0BD|nr:uncharacterized protein F54H12.2-like [Harpegnathos saltator]
MDALPGATLSNHRLDKRTTFVQGGRTLDLIGHLHCDVFNQGKFLINGVEVRMRLVRLKDSFCLMEENTMSRIRILDATLLIRRARINPGILLAHMKMLTRTTAKYSLTRVEVKSFTIHSGVVEETLNNVILGQIPKRIIVGFVDNKTFNCARHLNPFNFQHYVINFFSLYVDGVQISSRPLQLKFSGNGMLYAEAYHTLFSGTDIHFLNETNSISREDYPASYTLFAFDLTPDLSGNCVSQWNLVKHCSLRMEVRFEKAFTITVNCLVYAEFENVLEINSSHQVISKNFEKRTQSTSSRKEYSFGKAELRIQREHVIIEVQCFRDSNDTYVLKEVAIVSINEAFVGHWILAPEYSFAELNKKSRWIKNWLSLNYYGIEW